MTLYLDSSAFLKLYVEEPESEACRELLAADPQWTSGRHTLVEVRRNLTRLLRGRQLSAVRDTFGGHWGLTDIVELDEDLCAGAADIAERTLVRALDALHLAAARRFGEAVLVTYDRKQAEAARALGLTVAGV